jgi:propanol-preferring alcohol dehydrogenase
MRAYAVVENNQPLTEIELPTPEPKGKEVLLEVTHCGVCHSDIHIWEGKYDLGGGKVLSLKDRGVSLPLAMGHEIVGRVVKLGPEAEGKGVVVGGQYVVFPWVGCGTCPACLAEEDNYCPKQRSIGVHRHGGYATHVLVPEPRHLVAVDGVDPALAATYACSGITVYSAIMKVMPLPPRGARRAVRRRRARACGDRGASGARPREDRLGRHRRREACGRACRGRDRGG